MTVWATELWPCSCLVPEDWPLGVEEYEEYEGSGSPQAPRALLTPLLRGTLGIPGVKGRQEFGGTNPWPLGVEEYEEYDGRGSPQAPRALLRPLLRSPFGIPGVKGRQELGKFKSKKPAARGAHPAGDRQVLVQVLVHVLVR